MRCAKPRWARLTTTRRHYADGIQSGGILAPNHATRVRTLSLTMGPVPHGGHETGLSGRTMIRLGGLSLTMLALRKRGTLVTKLRAHHPPVQGVNSFHSPMNYCNCSRKACYKCSNSWLTSVKVLGNRTLAQLNRSRTNLLDDERNVNTTGVRPQVCSSVLPLLGRETHLLLGQLASARSWQLKHEMRLVCVTYHHRAGKYRV